MSASNIPRRRTEGAAWTTTLFDLKGARVGASGDGHRSAAGKYLPG